MRPFSLQPLRRALSKRASAASSPEEGALKAEPAIVLGGASAAAASEEGALKAEPVILLVSCTCSCVCSLRFLCFSFNFYGCSSCGSAEVVRWHQACNYLALQLGYRLQPRTASNLQHAAIDNRQEHAARAAARASLQACF